MRPPEEGRRLLRSLWVIAVGWPLQGCSTNEPGLRAGSGASPRAAEVADSTPEATGEGSSPEEQWDGGDAADATVRTDSGDASDASHSSDAGNALDTAYASDAADITDGTDYDAPESYLAAESVIRTSCAFIRCHGGAVRGGAGLWFGQTTSIREPLVNVVACEYSKMMRVAPGDVANSWMMVKLTAPQDPQTHAILFSPAADWVPNPNCGLDPADSGGAFGVRMPQTGMFQLDSDSLGKLAAWIEAGAPGPP